MKLSAILKSAKKIANNQTDFLLRAYLKKSEIKKFRDPRRVGILSSITLTEEQKSAIDTLYLENYGKKIPHTWHKHFTAYTGKFDPYYFPELLFIPAFEKFMNDRRYTAALSDKSLLTLLAAADSVQVKMPKTYVSSTRGLLQDGKGAIISQEKATDILNSFGDSFIKPSVDSSSGQNCMKLKVKNGIDESTGWTIDKVFAAVGSNFVAQECITCHPSIRAIYPNSVNTFRIITYIWKDTIEHMPIIMRIGRNGSYVDNAHAGGMFIAVSDEGVLHKKAFTEFKDEFEQHPDTGIVFAGHKIENMAGVIDAAKRMHRAISQVGCINWDFTIDEEGTPILIEANINGGSVWLIEMAHGCGAFGKHTPEILQWIRFCESIPQSERHKYSYGYMNSDHTHKGKKMDL